jgi:phosphoribosyl 1,2-cyclic phosphodiesterase
MASHRDRDGRRWAVRFSRSERLRVYIDKDTPSPVRLPHEPGSEKVDQVSSAARSAPAATGPDAAVTVRCGGVRGSIPSPGPHTVRYGGNTSCVELRFGDTRLVLDAGSGIRSLGQRLVADGVKDHVLLLTHFHWDHIQGFPFFGPLHDPESTLRVLGPAEDGTDLEKIFEHQMDPVFFPVPLASAAAELHFETMGEGPLHVGEAVVHAMRVKHPSHVLGYRIEVGGTVVCYVPDNELEGDGYPVDEGWKARMRRFVEGADLLIHDAMYTGPEYDERRGWGHSTFDQALALAEETGVARLLFFHHDPSRTDDQLDAIVGGLRDRAGARGCPVDIEAAAENTVIRMETLS